MTPTILHTDHILLMDQHHNVFPNGAVLFGSDSCIQQMGEPATIIAANPGVEVQRLENRLQMSKLAGTHMHSDLLRGMGGEASRSRL